MTIIQAEEFDDLKGNYADDQLKRWFLILEELLNDSEKSKKDYTDIRYIRNFVSHHNICDPQIIALLEKELPGAVYVNMTGKQARFLRDDPSHVAFVSKYQNKARQWAKDLVKVEIKKQGGNVD